MNDYANMFSQLTAGPNMLQQAQQAQEFQSRNLANQASRQQLVAREAIGPIMQKSINPETGEIDYNKFILGISANPDTAWMAPEYIEKALARQVTQRELVLKDLEINQKQQAAIYDAVAGLLPHGPSLRQDHMRQAAKELYTAGVIDKDHYVNFVVGLPQDGAPIYSYAKEIALRAQGAAKSLNEVYQAITPQDAGDRTVFTQTDPMNRTVRKVGEVQKGLSPQLVEGIDEKGAPIKAPSTEAFPSRTPQAPGDSMGAGEGQDVGSPLQPNVQSPPIKAPWRTGLPPQQMEGWKKLGETYTEIMKFSRDGARLEHMLDTAERLIGEYQPGAGADIRAKIAYGLSAMGVKESLVNQVANGSLAKGQAFKSIMLDLATGRMKEALEGGGRFTNTEFGAFTAAKPNENMTPEAVRELFQYYRRNIKLDRAWIKGYNHFMNEGKTATDFVDWWAERQEELAKLRSKK